MAELRKGPMNHSNPKDRSFSQPFPPFYCVKQFDSLMWHHTRTPPHRQVDYFGQSHQHFEHVRRHLFFVLYFIIFASRLQRLPKISASLRPVYYFYCHPLRVITNSLGLLRFFFVRGKLKHWQLPDVSPQKSVIIISAAAPTRIFTSPDLGGPVTKGGETWVRYSSRVSTPENYKFSLFESPLFRTAGGGTRFGSHLAAIGDNLLRSHYHRCQL